MIDPFKISNFLVFFYIFLSTMELKIRHLDGVQSIEQPKINYFQIIIFDIILT